MCHRRDRREKLNVLLKETSAGHMAAGGHSGYKPATTWLQPRYSPSN